MGSEQEMHHEEETADSGEARERAGSKTGSRPTWQIRSIEGQIVNAGGEMSLSGDVTMNAAFSGATMNIQSHLESASDAADEVPHGDERQRAALVQLVQELRVELEKASQQHGEETLKLAKRLDALMQEVAEEKPDAEMVTITGKGLKRAAANLATVLPTVVRIATEVVNQAGLLVR